jgi:transposase-like protein
MRSILEVLTMTSVSYVEKARAWSRTLEDREASRSHQPIKQCRPTVARKTGIAPGTLANLRNGRLKAVSVHVYERLRASVEQELVSEMKALEHELQTLRQIGLDPREAEVEQVVAHLQAARSLLGLPSMK